MSQYLDVLSSVTSQESYTNSTCLKQEHVWTFPLAMLPPSSTFILIEFKSFMFVTLLGLMADRMGSYHGAFYLAGSTVILGAAIPFILFFVKRPIAHHEFKGHIEKHDIQGSDIPCHENLAYVGELGANHETETHTNSPCGGGKCEMIDMSLSGVNDTVLPCTEEDSCSGSQKIAENNAGNDTTETEARDDDLISNDTNTQDSLQSHAYQVEVQIDSPLASTGKVDNEQETTKHDTKF